MNTMKRIALPALAFVVALPGGLAGAEGEAARQAEAAGVWLDEDFAVSLCRYAALARRFVKDRGESAPAEALKYARAARGLADEAAKWSGGKSCRQLLDEQQTAREAECGHKAADTFGEPLSCSELREAEREAGCRREAVGIFGKPLSCSELQEVKEEVRCRREAADTFGEPMSCSELREAEAKAEAEEAEEACRRELTLETFLSADEEAMARWECLCGDSPFLGDGIRPARTRGGRLAGEVQCGP